MVEYSPPPPRKPLCQFLRHLQYIVPLNPSIPSFSQDAEHLSFGPIDDKYDKSPNEDAKKASVVVEVVQGLLCGLWVRV